MKYFETKPQSLEEAAAAVARAAAGAVARSVVADKIKKKFKKEEPGCDAHEEYDQDCTDCNPSVSENVTIVDFNDPAILRESGMLDMLASIGKNSASRIKFGKISGSNLQYSNAKGEKFTVRLDDLRRFTGVKSNDELLSKLGLKEEALHEEEIDPQLKKLFRMGLIDKSQMAIAIRAFKDPEKAMKNKKQREILTDVLEKLTGMIGSDQNLFNKTKASLAKEEAETETEPKSIEDKKIDQKIKLLLRMGLVDKKDVQKAIRVLKDPDKAAKSPALRGTLLDMINKLITMQTKKGIYQRVRRMLTQKPKGESGESDVSEEMGDAKKDDKLSRINNKIKERMYDGRTKAGKKFVERINLRREKAAKAKKMKTLTDKPANDITINKGQEEEDK